ncbi:AraC family transcriptional regulator [Reichenbachiella versicolor]|uniref:AraC family transcriptional regulator n=1 Tax=Reichenbachiella versicolor TaxID=1821036 RepID=UPI0013A55C8F|nr:helix-turn-helix transcriptional regulator [Reichenbachiella versicolor]
MQPLKTYHQVNAIDESISFSVSRMDDIYDRRKGQQDEPHRHDFFTVIITKSAKGQHVIDFKSYELKGNQIYFINPGQVHQLIEEQRSIGYAITFSNEFLAHNYISIDFIDNLNVFQDFGSAPPLEADNDELQQICSYAEQLINIYGSDQPFKYDALGALLKLMLIESNNLCQIDKTDISADTSQSLLLQYKNLLNENFKSWHTVNEYADQLNVTPDYLNRVVKNLTGKTAKEHIQSRIILAAKRMIYFSELTNKELAYDLGFTEPANFTAFFKKCTGIPPSEFRKRASKALF